MYTYTYYMCLLCIHVITHDTTYKRMTYVVLNNTVQYDML